MNSWQRKQCLNSGQKVCYLQYKKQIQLKVTIKKFILNVTIISWVTLWHPLLTFKAKCTFINLKRTSDPSNGRIILVSVICSLNILHIFRLFQAHSVSLLMSAVLFLTVFPVLHRAMLYVSLHHAKLESSFTSVIDLVVCWNSKEKKKCVHITNTWFHLVALPFLN